MPKIDPDILKDFGKAVRFARASRGWDQAMLGGKMQPVVGTSFVSKVEKGRRDALSATTVGRFVNALDLEKDWIKKFIDAEDSVEDEETQAEREADKVVARLRREGAAEGTPDDLLIQLANNFTEGDHKDTDTAYRSVRAALETMRDSEEVASLAGNADAQFAALVQEVDALNAEGEFDLAAEKLERQAADIEHEQERVNRLHELQLRKEISQDRLRNRPDLAAERIVQSLQRSTGGGIFWKLDDDARVWAAQGHKQGDLFSLNVGVELSRKNYQTKTAKKPLKAAAYETFAFCNFTLGEHTVGIRRFLIGKKAFDAAARTTPRVKRALDWARRMDGLGQCLMRIGERSDDKSALSEAGEVFRKALQAAPKDESDSIRHNLGRTYSILGYIDKNASVLEKALHLLLRSLEEGCDLDQAVVYNNIALTRRRLGEVTGSLDLLEQARQDYSAAEALEDTLQNPFSLAVTHWNIADLALARFALAPEPVLISEAREYVDRARAFFVEGSEFQTGRCDELSARIDAAENT